MQKLTSIYYSPHIYISYNTLINSLNLMNNYIFKSALQIDYDKVHNLMKKNFIYIGFIIMIK